LKHAVLLSTVRSTIDAIRATSYFCNYSAMAESFSGTGTEAHHCVAASVPELVSVSFAARSMCLESPSSLLPPERIATHTSVFANAARVCGRVCICRRRAYQAYLSRT
jgi:hypothetical protein